MITRDKILVVDNEPHAPEQWAGGLPSGQYETVFVRQGTSALEQIGERSFDLILADLSVPEMKGLQLLKKFDDLQNNLPTVVMTDRGDIQRAVLSVEFGAQGFLLKPFTSGELTRTVEGALQKSRFARAREDVRRVEDSEAAHSDVIRAFSQALEAKDNHTGWHCDRMVTYALAIGRHLGLSPEKMTLLRYAAVLHDVGKIGVPDSILKKPGKLTDDEYEMMKTHPHKGAEMIRDIEFLAPVAPLVYYHQERYDGKGYPSGLQGEEIPLEARIVAVLDAFDAMTSDRPYRKAMPVEKATAELKRYSNRQFDPRIVEVFTEVLRDFSAHSLQHSEPNVPTHLC